MGLGGCSDPFRNVPPLDAEAYSASANSLRGNEYQFKGAVRDLLAWSPSGRLISVGVGEDPRAIPVLLSNEFNEIQIRKGEMLRFRVIVEDKGILKALKVVVP